jgi:hypothetical protein
MTRETRRGEREIIVLIDKRQLQNKNFVQRKEDTKNGVPVEGDIIERARAAGINPRPILEDIINAVKSVNSSKSDGIFTDADVELIRKILIEKVQQKLNKYQIDRLEIGRYPDPYVMDGYTEVRLFLSSSGRPYKEYYGGRIQFFELSSSVLRELHSSKHILSNLLLRLIDMTEKNKAKIREIEEFANSSGLKEHDYASNEVI